MLFCAGFFADIMSLFCSDLQWNSQFLSPPPPCVLGRSAWEQGFWGSCKGTLSVPGKNIFISFHMDGAWWTCFNVPWVCRVVPLYGIFYYLMGKKMYHYGEGPKMSKILPDTPLLRKLFSSFCGKKKKVCGGQGGKRDFSQERIIPW